MIFKNDKDFQVPRENRCCVCGEQEDTQLTRHHIIPSCYSSKLSSELKKDLHRKIHLYYYEWDYCCACKKCHIEYEEKYSDMLHEKIRNRYSVNLEDTSYRNLDSDKPKPSELVMAQINSIEQYLELREFCTQFFIEKMKPKFSLI